MSEGNNKLKEAKKELQQLFNKVNEICRENEFGHFSIVDTCVDVEEGGGLKVSYAIPENSGNVVILHCAINDLFENDEFKKLMIIAGIASGRVSIRVLNEMLPDEVKH